MGEYAEETIEQQRGNLAGRTCRDGYRAEVPGKQVRDVVNQEGEQNKPGRHKESVERL